jgi:hypothetical protein
MRKCRALAGATALACTLVAAGPGAVSARADPETLRDIERSVGIDDIPADYVILADTSQSMRADDRYGNLKKSLRNFFAALAPNDTLTLIAFDRKARVVHQGRVGDSPDTLVDKLPARADGTATDIGAALEQAVNALSRDQAPGIASVVLVTDGRHEPPKGSPYPTTSGYRWQQLRDRVQDLDKTVLKSYALPLAGATGTSLMGTVFDRPRKLNAASAGQVTELLEVPKREARTVKVREAVAPDNGRGLELSWSEAARELAPGANDVELVVRSTTAAVPLELSGLSVTSDNPRIQVRVSDGRLAVAPQATVRVRAVITWDAGQRSYAYRDPVDASTTLRASGTVGTPWAATLTDDVGLRLTNTLTGTSASGLGSANLGRPWIYWLAAALLALLAGALLLAAHRRPRLSGELLITSPNVGAPRAVRLTGSGRSARLGPAQTGESQPIRVRLVRAAGGKQLRLTIGRTVVQLRPAAERMHQGVLYEWVIGGRRPVPAAPHPYRGSAPAPAHPAPTPANPAPAAPAAASPAPVPAAAPAPVVSPPRATAPAPSAAPAPVPHVPAATPPPVAAPPPTPAARPVPPGRPAGGATDEEDELPVSGHRAARIE